jgi:hypothetical protein
MAEGMRHWSEDRYWAKALHAYSAARRAGRRRLELDLDRIEAVAFLGDGPAYRLMEAMESVRELEGEDGYRGAPRLMLALLERLREISETPAET